MSGRASSRGGVAAWALLTPALLLYGAFVILPWLRSLQFSFFDWDGIGVARFVGLQNYQQVFADASLRSAIGHSFGLMLFYTVVPLALGLVLAVLISRLRRTRSVVATTLFLPQILPLVAVGVVWRFLYGEDGPINAALSAIGLEGATRAWLGDFTFAFPAVGFVGTWVSTGLCTLLILSGLQRVDPSLYEAARLDGAGPVREFFAITVPSVRPEMAVAATVTMVSALASFDLVYVLTGGGPGEATMVPGVLIYRLVFTANKVGLACALGVVLSLLTILVVTTLNLLERRAR